MTAFVLRPGSLTLEDLRGLMKGGTAVELDAAAGPPLRRPAKWSAPPPPPTNRSTGSTPASAASPGPVSRPTTSASCSAGWSAPTPSAAARRSPTRWSASSFSSRSNSLARGHSGVGRPLIEALVALLNSGVLPCVPARGSAGASGDLAPLAHLALVLLGEGEVRIGGEIVSGAAVFGGPALRRWPWKPRRGWRSSTAPRSQRPWRRPACWRSNRSSPPPWWPAR